jgi:hypothetical protein
MQDKGYLDRYFRLEPRKYEAWVLVIRLRRPLVYAVQVLSKFSSLTVDREERFPKENSVLNWILYIWAMFRLF